MRTPGRAAGRVATLAALVAPFLLGGPAGCTATEEAPITVTKVEPGTAFNDDPVIVTVRGKNFRPAYRIDTRSGSGSVDPGTYSAFLIPIPDDPMSGLTSVAATQVLWAPSDRPPETAMLTVHLPPHIRVGVYDLAVRAPRGDVAILERAFVSLGPDTVPPRLKIEEPKANSVVGAGSRVTVFVRAEDEGGDLASLHLEVSGPGGIIPSGDCIPLPQVGCSYSFQAPEAMSPLDVLFIEATAEDNKGNIGHHRIPLGLAPRPIVTSFSPTIGPASGGTIITVTGRYFVPGQEGDLGTQLQIDGLRLDNMVVTPTTITGTTFAHDEGEGQLAVRTGGAATPAGKFTFVPRPLIRQIFPATGPSEGGTPVMVLGNGFNQSTTIAFGVSSLVGAQLVSSVRIDGILPPGVGTVIVRAIDGIGGVGEADFTYDAPLIESQDLLGEGTQ